MYSFAAVGGEPHVRVLFGDELQVFGAVGRGTHWHRLVGARDEDVRAMTQASALVAGGQIEVAAASW